MRVRDSNLIKLHDIIKTHDLVFVTKIAASPAWIYKDYRCRRCDGYFTFEFQVKGYELSYIEMANDELGHWTNPITCNRVMMERACE